MPNFPLTSNCHYTRELLEFVVDVDTHVFVESSSFRQWSHIPARIKISRDIISLVESHLVAMCGARRNNNICTKNIG
jgi:hypothetical protein